MASEPSDAPSAVTIGTFDGVHLGHQALLDRAHDAARSQGLTSVALTFRRPPQNELGHPKPLLLPPEEKLTILGEHVDRVGVLDFQEIRWLAPDAFVSDILYGTYNARVVVTGSDFRFGRDRGGDVEMLRTFGAQYGMSVEIVEPVDADGHAISSTAIRHLLRKGRVRDAADLLGRPPRLVGQVVAGAGEGKRLGYPTANLHVDSEVLLPADGIYAAWTQVEDRQMPSALYIGNRPTFNAQDRSLEVHVLEPPERSLYEMTLRVELIERVRPDAKFDSLDALKDQIASDLDDVRAILATS